MSKYLWAQSREPYHLQTHLSNLYLAHLLLATPVKHLQVLRLHHLSSLML